MLKEGFSRVVESGVFVWPWKEPQGLLVIRGAAGGGGGGGGQGFAVGDGGITGADGSCCLFPYLQKRGYSAA